MDPTTQGHLRILSVFHFVVAGFGALFSLFPGVYIALGGAMVSGALPMNDPRHAPPAAFGWILVAMGAIFMLIGLTYVALLVFAGRFLARRRHWTFCLVVAAISCALFPIGTVLGVFTILVLTKPDVKAAFEGERPDAAGPLPTRLV